MRHFIFWLVLSILLYFGIEIAFGHSDPAWYSIAYAMLISIIVTMFFGSMILNVLLGGQVQRAFTSGNWLQTSMTAIENSIQRLFGKGKKKSKKKVSKETQEQQDDNGSESDPAMSILGWVLTVLIVVAILSVGFTYSWAAFGIEILAICLLLALVFLASLFNFGFGQVEEGCIVIILYGSSAGKYLMQVARYRIDRETGEIEEGRQSLGIADWFPIARWFFGLTGVWWFGIPGFTSVHETVVEHSEFEKKSGSNTIVPCTTTYTQIPFRQSHAVLVPRAEAKDTRFDFDIPLWVTTEFTNIGIAEFMTDPSWIVNLESSLQAAIRQYVAELTFEKVIKIHSEGKNSLLDHIKKTIEDNLRDKYGIKIVDIDLRQVIPPADIRDAITAHGKAIEQKKVIIESASAEKEANKLRGAGRKSFLKQQGEGEAAAAAEILAAVGGDPRTLIRLRQADAGDLRNLKETQVRVYSTGNATGVMPTVDALDPDGEGRRSAPIKDNEGSEEKTKKKK